MVFLYIAATLKVWIVLSMLFVAYDIIDIQWNWWRNRDEEDEDDRFI
jgi:hypothetical protein